MKKIIGILIILISALGLKAQITQIPTNDSGLITHGQFHIRSSEVPILGSPYLNEIYKQGETIISGKKQTTALMRYNALDESIELLDGSRQKPKKLLRRKNITATFDGRTYLVMEYAVGNEIKLGYFNQLNSGKVSLLYRPKKIFVQAENPENGYDQYDPPTYKDVSQYYIKVGDKTADLIKLNKRHILKVLDDKVDILKPFIKKHRLSLKKESDIILLLNYYNSLFSKREVNSMGPTGIAALY